MDSSTTTNATACTEGVVSRETLTYLGLTWERGDDIWHEWCEQPHYSRTRHANEPDHTFFHNIFYEFIMERILSLDADRTGVGDSAETWPELLDSCGLAPNFGVEARADPLFARVEWEDEKTGNLPGLVEQVIEVLYRALEEVENSLQVCRRL